MAVGARVAGKVEEALSICVRREHLRRTVRIAFVVSNLGLRRQAGRGGSPTGLTGAKLAAVTATPVALPGG